MRFRRVALIAGCCAGLAGGVITGGSTAAAAMATTPPRADLAQFACHKALDPANRSVSIQAVMRPLNGTRRLAVRFDLRQSTPSSATVAAVHATGLGTWITPITPTLGQLPGDVWRLNKDVLNLDAPATYQFRVTYRWTGAHGKVLGTATRLSRTCHQKELRPDLAVQAIAVSAVAGHPGEDLYAAAIADQGLTGAGPFEVLFAPGDASAPITRTVSLLHAGEMRQLSFVGPACDPASPPTVTVDATSVVDDFNRANNVMTAVCPAVTTTTPARRGR